MVLLYEHWLVTETTLMALLDIVMSVRGAPTTAAAVGPTDCSLSNTTTGNTRKTMSCKMQNVDSTGNIIGVYSN